MDRFHRLWEFYETMAYGTASARAWRVARIILSPVMQADIGVLYRKDLTAPLVPSSARVPVEVTLASEADLDEAARLPGAPHKQRAERFRSWLRRGDNKCFVAKVGPTIVAYDWLCLREVSSDGGYSVVLKDGDVYGHNGYTARGWRGNAILGELQNWWMLFAQQAGYRTAYSWVSAANTRSAKVLRRRGWEVSGTMFLIRERWAERACVWRLSGSVYPISGRGTGLAEDGERRGEQPNGHHVLLAKTCTERYDRKPP